MMECSFAKQQVALQPQATEAQPAECTFDVTRVKLGKVKSQYLCYCPLKFTGSFGDLNIVRVIATYIGRNCCFVKACIGIEIRIWGKSMSKGHSLVQSAMSHCWMCKTLLYSFNIVRKSFHKKMAWHLTNWCPKLFTQSEPQPNLILRSVKRRKTHHKTLLLPYAHCALHSTGTLPRTMRKMHQKLPCFKVNRFRLRAGQWTGALGYR